MQGDYCVTLNCEVKYHLFPIFYAHRLVPNKTFSISILITTHKSYLMFNFFYETKFKFLSVTGKEDSLPQIIRFQREIAYCLSKHPSDTHCLGVCGACHRAVLRDPCSGPAEEPVLLFCCCFSNEWQSSIRIAFWKSMHTHAFDDKPMKFVFEGYRFLFNFFLWDSSD